MSTISVRFNDKDDTLIRKYANLHGMDLSTFIRQAALEKIEDDYDLALFNKVWKEEKNKELMTHDALEKELNL
jgi:uncharacterized protein (DUF1778 family)